MTTVEYDPEYGTYGFSLLAAGVRPDTARRIANALDRADCREAVDAVRSRNPSLVAEIDYACESVYCYRNDL